MKAFTNDKKDELEYLSFDEITSYNNDSETKSKTNIKYLKDTSYDLFNEIFSDMEFENLEGEKIQISDYQDFYNFQLDLNSKYNVDIKFFDYKKELNSNIIKEIPYKETRLRALSEEDNSLIISPNGHFVQTPKKINKSESTLEHYKTVIGNSLILKGEYYFEIKILELGNNTDMCFGIISRNSVLLNSEKYKNFPLCEFEDCYGFNLKNTFYEKKYSRKKKIISVGTIISIQVNLNKSKISILIDSDEVENNSLNIKDGNLGYYPAFSLSYGKEIQVKFGGIYNLSVNFETFNQIDAKPICQYNNLENIVSCYMKIIDNYLIKIINHKQISYNDSIKYFNPMIKFFANIAFSDEYIMKNYLLKFMYKNYFEDKDINKYFDERYNFLYLIINNIEKNKQQKYILFLLDCLSEDIKLDSYILYSSNEMLNPYLGMKLYNFFLKKNLFKEILFPEGKISEIVYKKLKYQFYIIFQSIKIYGNTLKDFEFDNVIKIAKEEISKFILNKNYIECFSQLIETLFGLDQKNQKSKMDKIDELIKRLKNESKGKNSNLKKSNEENEELIISSIFESFLFDEIKFKKFLGKKNIISKKLKFDSNPYRKIFFDLMNDIFENKTKNDNYNIISTIILPLINLFNIYYDKENSINYTKENILSNLPLLCVNDSYLKCKGSKLLISEKFLTRKNSIEEILDKDIIFKELSSKKFNYSSNLIRLLIILSAFLEKETFNLNFYLKNEGYQKIIKRLKSKSKEVKINYYIEKIKKIIYLSNQKNGNIIYRTLTILIPYLNELLDNNFYLILPYKIMNLLKFFIKFISYNFFIFKDNKIIKNKNTINLIQIFVSINFKLLDNNNTTKRFFFYALDNIKFLYDMFCLIKKNDSLSSGNYFDGGMNNSLKEVIKDFKFYIKDNDLDSITNLLRIYYENHGQINKKYLTNFLMHFSTDIFSGEINKNNLFIPAIINNLDKDNNNFWIVNFIIEYLIKRKLVSKIHKIENIFKNEKGKISKRTKLKIKKYATYIIKIINFLSSFIIEEKVIYKYFNFYIDDKKENDEEKNDSNKFSIYCYFIYLTSLIIKNLFNYNFLHFCSQIMQNPSNNNYLDVKCLAKISFSFLEKILIFIPGHCAEIINEREKNKIDNKIKNQKKIEIEKEREKKVSIEDLTHYSINIINNINLNDIGKLKALFETNFLLGLNKEIFEGTIRNIMILLNLMKNKFGKLTKKSNQKNENEDSNICPICLDKENDIHVSPCGHMFCFICIKKLTNNICPICRVKMDGIKEHPEFKFDKNVEQRQIFI